MRVERALGIVIIVIGAVLLGVGLLAPSGHFGMMGGTGYSGTNIFLIAAGIVMIAVGVVLMFVKLQTEAPRPPEPVLTQAPPPVPTGPEVQTEAQSIPSNAEAEGHDELVLRLLTGDERVIYKAVVDSGGTALQKDLIVRTRMSDAKVSRTIDKLVEKGIVTKERYGVTNKITTNPTGKPSG